MNLNVKHNETQIASISSSGSWTGITLNTKDKVCTDKLKFEVSDIDLFNNDKVVAKLNKFSIPYTDDPKTLEVVYG